MEPQKVKAGSYSKEICLIMKNSRALQIHQLS